MFFLQALPILADGQIGCFDRLLLLNLSPDLDFLLVLIGQGFNEFIGPAFGLGAVEHVVICVVSIFDGDIVGLVGRIISIVLKHILILLALEPELKFGYIDRLLNTCCITFLLYLLISSRLPVFRSRLILFCCSSSC